jgi:hypothetical protein
MELVFHRAREGGEKDIPKRRDDWERKRRRPRIESTPGASTRGRGGPAGSTAVHMISARLTGGGPAALSIKQGMERNLIWDR